MRSARLFLKTNRAPEIGSKCMALRMIPKRELKLLRISVSCVHRNILVLPVVPSTRFLLQRLNNCLHQGYFNANENYDASTREHNFGHFVVGQLKIIAVRRWPDRNKNWLLLALTVLFRLFLCCRAFCRYRCLSRLFIAPVKNVYPCIEGS